MKKQHFLGAVLPMILILSCSVQSPDALNSIHYRSFSRLTDPGDFSFMLRGLPKDIPRICEIAKQQTVHHNLLPYFGIPSGMWTEMNRLWPSGAPIPGMSDMLAALRIRGLENDEKHGGFQF